jgi:hypothetical protein
MEPPSREVIPADVPSVAEQEWEQLGRAEIPDPDDEAVRELVEDVGLDPGNPLLRCELAAALTRAGHYEAAGEQLREVWRRLTTALAADPADIEALLAAAYAVERAGVCQPFTGILLHLPGDRATAFPARCLLAISMSTANDPSGAAVVLQHSLETVSPTSPELEALARLVLAHSLRACGDPSAAAAESLRAQQLVARSRRAELLRDFQAELETSPSILPRDCRPGD